LRLLKKHLLLSADRDLNGRPGNVAPIFPLSAILDEILIPPSSLPEILGSNIYSPKTAEADPLDPSQIERFRPVLIPLTIPL
jgi:hypothetical protein